MKEKLLELWLKVCEFFKSEWFVANIKPIILWLLGIIVTLIITNIANKIINLLRSKVKNEKVSQLLENAKEIINKCSDKTTQQFVDGLKKAKKFDEEKQKEALNLTITEAKKTLSKELKQAIKKEYGNLTSFIEIQVESHLHEEKSK